MGFCPHCGANIPVEAWRFCRTCGKGLEQQAEVGDSSTRKRENLGVKARPPATSPDEEDAEASRRAPADAYNLGKWLEQTVEAILKRKGYRTKPRQRTPEMPGGGRFEIDIIAERGSTKLYVECKNFGSPVGVEHVTHFCQKLQEDGIENGLFVAIPRLTKDAQAFAEDKGLETWDEGELARKWLRVRIGRGEESGGRIEHCLPVEVSYSRATELGLANSERVEVCSAKLILRPFYRVAYRVDCRREDPAGGTHRVHDSGLLVLDALHPERAPKGAAKSDDSLLEWLLGTPDEGNGKDKESLILEEEVKLKPVGVLHVEQSDKFEVVRIPERMDDRAARRAATEHIVKKNTRTVEYEPRRKRRSDDIFGETATKRLTVKPSTKDVTLSEVKLVLAPKWEIEFQSRDCAYTRSLSGSSGKAIEDTIARCRHDFLDDLVTSSKATVAVCEVCGRALCKAHAHICPACGSWLCESHSLRCAGCKRRFCSQHLTRRCTECKSLVCDSCCVTCQDCAQPHCSSHMTKCAKCGRIVCASCTRKEGTLFFKKAFCKNC